MHKLVQTKTRAALKHERVVKLLFCYVNMRLLDNVDVDILGMVEDALMYELDCEEAETQARAAVAAAPQTAASGASGSGAAAGAAGAGFGRVAAGQPAGRSGGAAGASGASGLITDEDQQEWDDLMN